MGVSSNTVDEKPGQGEGTGPETSGATLAGIGVPTARTLGRRPTNVDALGSTQPRRLPR